MTARSTWGWLRLVPRSRRAKMAWPSRNEVNDAASPTASATAAALAAKTAPRRGRAVSDARIIPVEYSEVMVAAPSTATMSAQVTTPVITVLAVVATRVQ